MELTRRQFGKGTLAILGATAMGGSTLLLEGCNDQTTIAALLNEMLTAWSSLETALGKAVPANIATLFQQAVTAVQNWKSGTPAQDVIQVLQDLSLAIGDIGAVVPGMTAIEAAAVQIILGTIINIIELIDPAAVPATVLTAQKAMTHAVVNPVPQKHFRQGAITSAHLKAQFEAEWLAQTGKAA
jgi:hypothetical protein